MRRTRSAVATALLVLASTAACSGSDRAVPPGPGTFDKPTPVKAAPGTAGLSAPDQQLVVGSLVADDAPRSFTVRTRLADCGAVALGSGDKLPASAVRCLESATGTGAELIAVVPTIDDGPYVVYYRAGGSRDGLEVFTDGSRSPTGAFWQHETCTSLRTLHTMSSGRDCRLVEQTD